MSDSDELYSSFLFQFPDPTEAPAPVEEDDTEVPRGCFHGDSIVTTDHGSMTIANLAQSKNIRVLGLDGFKPTMADMMMWVHKEPDFETSFLHFELESGNSISMTREHLAVTVSCERGDEREAKFARRVVPGECMLVKLQDGMVPSRVQGIRKSEKRGIYAFVTTTDSVIVDGVAASTFTTLESEKLQRIWFNTVHKIVNMLPSSVQGFCYTAYENPAKFLFATSQV